MFGLFHHNFSKPPSLKQLPLKTYSYEFSLDRLTHGVDNIHFDVHISPEIRNALKRTIPLLMIKHSGAEAFSKVYKKRLLENEKVKLHNLCVEALMEAINRAKSESEVQLDFLAQASLAKTFLEEIKVQYEKLIEHFEDLIRTYELSHRHGQVESFKVKEKLNEVKLNRKGIIRLVGDELFEVLVDAHSKDLKNIRESNFPPDNILPDNFFLNPMFHVESPTDDFFLIEEYVLLSQRSEDPDNYNGLMFVIYETLNKTDLNPEGNIEGQSADENENVAIRKEALFHPAGKSIDPWIMEIGNIDLMFNFYKSLEQYKRSKKKKAPKEILRKLKSQSKVQRELLNLFYRKFKKSRLIHWIVAAYEMESVYGKYCPPLLPYQVRDYLVKPTARKQIVRQLKRLRSFYGESFSLSPLQKTAHRIKKIPSRKKKQYLLSFLKQVVRYHRDLTSFNILRNAMDAINLVTEEKILNLSRENRTLYEFLRPEEQSREMDEMPIINHVIIKADIRGSTDITYRMMDRGLNPASYFSLNFFDPITELLSEYGGTKEFIEGDAIILSIVENKDTPKGWYSVARSCGLAIRILRVVQQYNVESKKNNLPVLELGIGICYNNSTPAFLFDGEDRIMISPAINLADRLSGCAKTLRKRFKAQKRLFNLFVYQTVPEEESATTVDDLSLRYNVNGIELNPEGFEKLSREINLKSTLYQEPGKNTEKVKLYVGKVPILTGKYQRLVIREATIPEVEPETLRVIGKTSRKYYEVCTHPQIYEYVKKLI